MEELQLALTIRNIKIRNKISVQKLTLHQVIFAIQNARRGFPMNVKEAISIASMLQYADTLQVSLKAAVKENSNMYTRFMPLIERISAWSINRSIVKLIVQVVDEDGTVKDSAIPKLKQARRRVQELEKREVSNIDGRWCIRSGTDDLTGFNGLLLSRVLEQHCRYLFAFVRLRFS